MKNLMLALCMVGGLATAAMAADKTEPKAPAMTTEQRQKMADAHEKMAACLRSERPLADCHDEMMKSCKESGGCPMMGGKGHGKGHGGMRHGETKQP